MTLSPIDYWRVFALGQAVLVLMMTVFIIIRYLILLKKMEWKQRALPAHVILISISYLMMIVGSLIELHERIGTPGTWRSYLYPTAFLIGDIALIFMLLHLSVQRILVTAVLKQAQIQLKADRQHKENTERLDVIAAEIHEVAEVVKAKAEV